MDCLDEEVQPRMTRARTSEIGFISPPSEWRQGRAGSLPGARSLERTGGIDPYGFRLHFVVGLAAPGVVALLGLLRAEALRARFPRAHVAAGGMTPLALRALVAGAVAAAASIVLVAHSNGIRK